MALKALFTNSFPCMVLNKLVDLDDTSTNIPFSNRNAI